MFIPRLRLGPLQLRLASVESSRAVFELTASFSLFKRSCQLLLRQGRISGSQGVLLGVALHTGLLRLGEG